MKQNLRSIGAIIEHDLATELKSPVGLISVLVFGTGSLVTLHLALAGGGKPTPSVAAGALWIVLLFGALLGVGRVISSERETGAWDALVAAPCDRAALFIGKLGSAFGQIVLVHVFLVPLYVLLFGTPPGAHGVWELFGAVVLADVGFAATGVLVGVLALRARGRELITAAVLLPLTMPLLIGAVALSLHAWGVEGGSSLQYLTFLAAYDVTFIVAGIAAVPEIVVE